MKKSKKSNCRSYQGKRPLSTVVSSAAGLGRTAVGDYSRHKDCRVWLFRGELGAGKTTAIRAILRHLGVSGTISSPTFALMRVYRLRGRRSACHIDAYRIKDAVEWQGAGLIEAFNDPRKVLFVEWPEKLPGFAWGRRADVTIKIVPRGRRWSCRVVD